MEVAAQAGELLAAYRAALDRYPGLRGRLSGLAAHHARHRQLLGGGRERAAGPDRSPSVRAALAALARLEVATRRRRVQATTRARSGDLARVLASIAACQSQHLLVLALLAPTAPPAPRGTGADLGTGEVPPPAVEAVQVALAGEHAAVYAYGVAGAVVDPAGAAAARARTSYDAHTARRDQIEDLLRAGDEEPVVAEPAYGLPAPVTSGADAARLARRVEDRCAVGHAALVAASTDDLRVAATGWLADCATSGVGWGAAPTALPGVA